MNKELSKAIMHKSKPRNMHRKLTTKEQWEAFKRQRNKCVAIKRKNIRSHFTELTGRSGNCSKKFWSLIKLFLTNKHSGITQNIVLSENEIVMRDSTQVAEILNNYFDKYCLKLIQEASRTETGLIDDKTTDEIIDQYSNRSSVTRIKFNLAENPQAFSLKLASNPDIEKIISKLSLTTAIGSDGVPPKLVKLSNKMISRPLTELINETLIHKCHFPNAEKIACVASIFKKDDRLDKSNYRPIGVLNVSSKLFERFLLQQMILYFKNVLSNFLSGYRERYSCHYVLLRLIDT